MSNAPNDPRVVTLLGNKSQRAATAAFVALACALLFYGMQLVNASSADATTNNGAVTISNIAVNCSGNGTLTVKNPVAGDTVTLKVTYHTPGSGGTWANTSPLQTATVTLNGTDTSYAFTINVTDGYPANTNSIRVEVASTTGGSFTGVTTKSLSFGPCGTPTSTTTSPTSTTTSPTSTTSTTTSPTSSTTSTTTSPTSSTTSTTTSPTSTTSTTTSPTATAVTTFSCNPAVGPGAAGYDTRYVGTKLAELSLNYDNGLVLTATLSAPTDENKGVLFGDYNDTSDQFFAITDSANTVTAVVKVGDTVISSNTFHRSTCGTRPSPTTSPTSTTTSPTSTSTTPSSTGTSPSSTGTTPSSKPTPKVTHKSPKPTPPGPVATRGNAGASPDLPSVATAQQVQHTPSSKANDWALVLAIIFMMGALLPAMGVPIKRPRRAAAND